jgi:hypothetical protein
VIWGILYGIVLPTLPSGKLTELENHHAIKLMGKSTMSLGHFQ